MLPELERKVEEAREQAQVVVVDVHAEATSENIPSLGAGRSRTLSFTGPVCDPTDPPSVTADG